MTNVDPIARHVRPVDAAAGRRTCCSPPTWSPGSPSPRCTPWGCCAAEAAGTAGRDRYHRFGLLIPLTVAAIVTPIQIGVGDWIANIVAENQPVKLAAMEGLYETQSAVPLSLGGIYYDDELHYALEIPWGLSLLVHHDPNGEVIGLERSRPSRPPVNVVHLAYNTMVGIGSALLLLALVSASRCGGGAHWIENSGSCAPWRSPGSRRGRDGDGLDHHRGRAASR